MWRFKEGGKKKKSTNYNFKKKVQKLHFKMQSPIIKIWTPWEKAAGWLLARPRPVPATVSTIRDAVRRNRAPAVRLSYIAGYKKKRTRKSQKITKKGPEKGRDNM